MINFKKIPAIDEILVQTKVEKFISLYNREFVVDMVRKAVDELRHELRSIENELEAEVLMQIILQKMEKNILQTSRGTLQKV
ncbi:MAG: L-seryl-tRNA(Sec) selenium transferase, partial [Syntrophomonadaceae bacterium]|nr:L-seryl-tRNA(Sec) selenium transferase [Syntrophomonadaceae bacterium]